MERWSIAHSFVMSHAYLNNVGVTCVNGNCIKTAIDRGLSAGVLDKSLVTIDCMRKGRHTADSRIQHGTRTDR